LRQHKAQLHRRFLMPADLLPGWLSEIYLRCGKPTCHNAPPRDHGHPIWSFMVQRRKHTQRLRRDRLAGPDRCLRGPRLSEGDPSSCDAQRPTRGGGQRLLRRAVANLSPGRMGSRTL